LKKTLLEDLFRTLIPDNFSKISEIGRICGLNFGI